MRPRSAYTGSTRKLVLAFDIGTTYSGISYSILDPGLVPTIRGVTRFPAQTRIGGNAKIPSVLYYNQHGCLKGVGAETMEIDNSISHDPSVGKQWSKCEWFKLHLRPKQEVLDLEYEEALHPLPLRKTVVDTFADFMRYLYKCSKDFITDSQPNGSEYWARLQNNIEYVLTHPNGWEGAPQIQLRRAAVMAGLVSDNDAGHARIHFVTEGEASLHYCLQNGLEANISPGKGIIIVDAGGGTIDLSAYVPKPLSKGPYTFKEIAKATCVVQGSIFVTRRARKHLHELLCTSNFSDTASQERMLSYFDDITKLQFRDIQGPVYIKFAPAKGSEYDDVDFGIKGGLLRLTGTTVAKFFDPSVAMTSTAILAQKDTAKTPISSVFLVGGFGANDYLFNQLRTTMQSHGLSLSRPDSHINKAVADGAVSFYLDHFVSIRVSRGTYGVSCDLDYDSSDPEHYDRRKTAQYDEAGNLNLPNCFSVILPKDTQVAETKEYRSQFYSISQNRDLYSVSEEIICYRGQEGSPRWTDIDPAAFSRLCCIQADTTVLNSTLQPQQSRGGRPPHYRIEFEIILLFGLTELKAQIAWKENGIERRGPARIVYD
ncbi:hypothetical protein C8J56DRAFT_359740 [Mycena floridula]|nr:hypothetical protein C8J56DRAFT_359740 [Mycena floridula]